MTDAPLEGAHHVHPLTNPERAEPGDPPQVEDGVAVEIGDQASAIERLVNGAGDLDERQSRPVEALDRVALSHGPYTYSLSGVSPRALSNSLTARSTSPCW